MRRPEPRNFEASFLPHELFFSVTNKSGVIEFGNDVFVRVSGYSEAELTGQAHSIIRHPDMPRCIFKLLWDTISTGKPIVAYVKNLAKDGSYYWVLASVFSMPEGYISVRLKPSPTRLKVIEPLYRSLLEIERDRGMDAALEYAVSALGQLGFKSYERFGVRALREELEARDAFLASRGLSSQNELSSKFHASHSTHSDRKAAQLKSLFTETQSAIDAGDACEKAATSILNACQKLKLMVMNMTLGAEKVGESGKAFSQVAAGFSNIAAEIANNVKPFADAVSTLTESLVTTSLGVGAARLQIEMLRFFLLERSDPAGTTARYAEMLANLCDGYLTEVRSQSKDLLDATARLHNATLSLASSSIGLEVVKLRGAIEAAASGHEDLLKNHIDEMKNFLNDVKGPLAALEEHIKKLSAHAKNVAQLADPRR